MTTRIDAEERADGRRSVKGDRLRQRGLGRPPLWHDSDADQHSGQYGGRGDEEASHATSLSQLQLAPDTPTGAQGAGRRYG
jgi:hypothetical protein